MTLLEAISVRHSVRNYKDESIPADMVAKLNEEIEKINKEQNLHIQLVLNEPKAFHANKPHYGQFSGVKNYLALVGPKEKGMEEKLGYYGEYLVLLAQILGLNTCWVALTYTKIPGAFEIGENEKVTDVISIGFGVTQGHTRRSKTYEKVTSVEGEAPEWFKKGVEAALLAPTAINQQQFKFIYKDGKVKCKMGLGPCIKTDMGIVKYHFELAAGKENFEWE